MSQYSVASELTIDTSKSEANIKRLIASLNRVGGASGGSAMTASRSLGSLSGAWLRMGAAMGVVRMGTRLIWDQVEAASAFRAQLDDSIVSLAAIDHAVMGSSVADALETAKNRMREFNVLAAEAPGNAMDMKSIYERIVGPMANAGMGDGQIMDATKGVAIMGSAMGIKDTGALGRDIEEMLSGRAGMRTTKVFALAKAWGLIQEDTKEFNALPIERKMQIINDLIGKFAPFGEELGRSWGGVTESLGGWIDLLRADLTDSVFDQLSDQLYRFNKLIEGSYTKISAYLGVWGEAVGTRLDAPAAFIQGAAQAQPNYTGVAEGGAAGAAILGTSLAAAGVGQGLALAGVGGPLVGALSGPLLPLMAVVGVALAGVTAAFDLVADHADTLGVLLGVVFGGTMGMVLNLLGGVFWWFVEALKAAFGIISVVAIPLLSIFYLGLKVVFGALQVVVDVFRALWEVINELLAPVLESIYGTFSQIGGQGAEVDDAFTMIFSGIMDFLIMIAHFLAAMPGDIGDFGAAAEKALEGARLRGLERRNTRLGGEEWDPDERWAEQEADWVTNKAHLGEPPMKAPSGPQINVERMVINQEFKGKHDPDRVVASFLKAVSNQAEQKISSGFEPALAR
jgi:hypothetical protein